MDKIKFYYCYDLNLQKFLHDRGERFICKGIHPATYKLFHQYIMTKRLENHLNDYRKIKKFDKMVSEIPCGTRDFSDTLTKCPKTLILDEKSVTK